MHISRSIGDISQQTITPACLPHGQISQTSHTLTLLAYELSLDWAPSIYSREESLSRLRVPQPANLSPTHQPGRPPRYPTSLPRSWLLTDNGGMSCILQVQPSTPLPENQSRVSNCPFVLALLLDALLSTSHNFRSLSRWEPVAPLQKRPGAIQALRPGVRADPGLLRTRPTVLSYER